MSKRENLTIAEILLLIAMFACFAATLVFYILGYKELFLVFFILHACLCIGYFLVCQDVFTKAFLDNQEQGASLEEELALLRQNEEELKTLRKDLEEANSDKVILNKEIDSLTSEILALNVSLQEAKNAPSEPASASLRSLLPEDEHPEMINIIEVAKQVIEDMKAYSEPLGIQIMLSNSSDDIIVKADKSFIRIMFRNIVDNSIKYMNRTGSLVITISNIGEDLFIVLKDNGDGLSLSETEHIFELNYQGTNRVSGNGLGLTQAKAIVEYYGGTIYAKSGSGKGMGVYIQLPGDTNS